jgi:hypothetical protein
MINKQPYAKVRSLAGARFDGVLADPARPPIAVLALLERQ